MLFLAIEACEPKTRRAVPLKFLPKTNQSPYLLLANIGQLLTLRGETVPRAGEICRKSA